MLGDVNVGIIPPAIIPKLPLTRLNVVALPRIVGNEPFVVIVGVGCGLQLPKFSGVGRPICTIPCGKGLITRRGYIHINTDNGAV